MVDMCDTFLGVKAIINASDGSAYEGFITKPRALNFEIIK